MVRSNERTVEPAPAGAMTSYDLVDFLNQPAAYTERPKRVEQIETHISWVFLTDRFAYKLKKPVRYDFLDFRTAEQRRAACEEEVRLNRRRRGHHRRQPREIAYGWSGSESGLGCQNATAAGRSIP